MNPIMHPPAMNEIKEQMSLFSLGMATGLGEGKLNSNLLTFA